MGNNTQTTFESFAVTQPFTTDLMVNKLNDLLKVYGILGFTNEVVLEISKDIIEEAFTQSKKGIKISYTGDGELLIYREENGEYRNIIIDNDGDVEYLNIPPNRQNTHNEHIQYMNVNPNDLAAKL
jgi:hypothetical protein